MTNLTFKKEMEKKMSTAIDTRISCNYKTFRESYLNFLN